MINTHHVKKRKCTLPFHTVYANVYITLDSKQRRRAYYRKVITAKASNFYCIAVEIANQRSFYCEIDCENGVRVVDHVHIFIFLKSIVDARRIIFIHFPNHNLHVKRRTIELHKIIH